MAGLLCKPVCNPEGLPLQLSIHMRIITTTCCAGQRFDRVRVIAAGCFLWAIMTASFGLSHSLWQGILVWAVNGAGDSLLLHQVTLEPCLLGGNKELLLSEPWTQIPLHTLRLEPDDFVCGDILVALKPMHSL